MSMRKRFLIGLVSFFSCASLTFAAPEQKITAFDGAGSDNFGASVSIFGNVAIVGARSDDDKGDDSGSAYVYRLTQEAWAFEQKLTADDGAAFDWFGVSVSISGDVAIVGASQDDDNGSQSGSAYVFRKTGGIWFQEQKLTSPDGVASAGFGFSVSSSGDVVIVGADDGRDRSGTDRGSAYVYRLIAGTWTFEQKLTAADGTANDQFGVSVSISGDVAIVGAYADDDDGFGSGSSYVFRRNGGIWSQEQKLTASDGAAFAQFGLSVSILGDRALVGAPIHDNEGIHSGAAYVFRRDSGVWSQEQKLTASDGQASDQFGKSVSISDGLALVGADLDDEGGDFSGAAYVFRRNGAVWSQEQKLTAFDGDVNAQFGFAVSVFGVLAVVGAVIGDTDNALVSGSAYFFSLTLCGNGLINGGETCDDGNVAEGDGCSGSCAVEPGFVCTGEPSVCGCGGVSPGVPLFTDSGQALGDGFTWKALTGDIDNDGDPDIVSLEDAFYKVQIYLNDGDGLFSFSASKSFQRTSPHRSGALVDVDGDDNLDLLVGGDGSAAGVSIYSGDGAGAFTETWSNTWSYAAIDAVKVGDIDGNGSLDVVVAGFISDEESIQVCLCAGAGTYNCGPVISDISQAADVALTDFDNDFDLDLAAASLSFGPGGGSEIRVFLNHAGVLTSTALSIAAPYPAGLAAGDLDGDGDADLAVGNQASTSNQILFNDGTGTFADSGQSLGGEATNSVVLGDIDWDGDLDLLAINEGHEGRGYVVYSNNGFGSFTERESGSNNFKHNGNLVDVDADGDLDLVTGDYATGASNNHAPDQVLINNLMCTDDDECALGTHNCDVNATCTNTPGSFTCACNGGYQGDGFVCTLIDLCPADPHKLEPGICGCGVADTDTDHDGAADCNDLCPNDLTKTEAGICGCEVADTDTDGDGTANCHDNCPNDPNKSAPGICDCGTPDTDSDSDGTADCHDGCPGDPDKIAPGICDCSTPDSDSDSDGTADCHDDCPSDPNKTISGICGCNVADTDTDHDGAADCNDLCPSDPNKTAQGICGCGTLDTDTDGDGLADCHDLCPSDPNKTISGICGCGVADTDTDHDGAADCNDFCPIDPDKTSPGDCGCGLTDTISFVGFLPPIGGADATGGSFADSLRAFKLGSTIPVKFMGSQCGGVLLTGIHTLRAVKYSNAVDSDPPIDATPTDAATSGNQFRLTDSEWHFNLSTRTSFSQGTWKLIATLSDGSQHYAYVTIKK